MPVDLWLLPTVLSSSDLQIRSEDCLFDVINQLALKDSESLCWSISNSERIGRVGGHICESSLNASIWASLSNRLMLQVPRQRAATNSSVRQ
jgi:hypothetical protein